MGNLRHEVRASYERQQAGLGDVGDARHRLMQNALTAPPRDSHRLGWVAAIAAVLIAAVVIASFAIARAGSHPRAVPGTTSSPTALKNTLTVADSTPLILYRDPAKLDQLDGVTWDGESSGRLGNQQLAGVGNPQMNLFAGSDEISDRSGTSAMFGTFGAKGFSGTWADDGRHFCQVVPFDNPASGDVPTTLQLVAVGIRPMPRDVAHIGTLNNQTSVRAVSCSVLADRAVVVQSGGQGVGTEQVWAIQLSTGTILWTHSYDVAVTDVAVVASRDGMYVAENPLQSGPFESIVYGPDGKAVAHLTEWVVAFSWYGTLAAVAGVYGISPIEIVSWRDGRVVWSDPPGAGIAVVAPEPDGTRMAIWLGPMGGDQLTQTPDLYVVDATGSVTLHIAKAPPAPPA